MTIFEELFDDDPEIRHFREVFRKFVAREITPYVEEWEKNRSVPREIWRKMGKQGFLCPWLPEEYGGMGLDFRYSVVINQELVRGNGLDVDVPYHSDVAVPYLYSFGSEELKRRLLPKTTTGEAICCLAITEPNAGSDVSAIKTRAVKDGKYYIINGQKTFISLGMSADIMIVACKIGDQGKISLLVVEGESLSSVHRRKLEKMGRHGQDTAELFFEDCKVPETNLLGEEGKGFRYIMEKFNQERLEVCVKCQTLAEECFKEALEYAKVREAFGRPIGNLEYLSFKLAEMATEVELGRTFLKSLIEDFMKGKDIGTKVAMAKAFLAEMVNRVAYEAVQIHGGYGYMAEYRISRLYQDVRCLPIMGGTTEVMKLIIARKLGLDPL